MEQRHRTDLEHRVRRLIKTLDEPICCIVEFSPDGRFLVTNSNRVSIWSVENWELLSTVAVQGESPSGVMVCFSPDSRLLAVSDAIGRIHLVNPTTGKTITTLTNPHEAGSSAMTFSPNGERLAVSFAGSVHVWDLVALNTSLIELKLGGPQMEKQLATMLSSQVEKRSLAPSTDTVAAAPIVVDSNKPSPIAKVNARFVLDQHFRQLAVAENIQRAQISVERGEMSAARNFVQQAISRKPESPANCNNLAWFLATGPTSLRDTEQAEKLARRAVEMEPDQATYQNTLGVALYRTGKYSEAITALERSLAFTEPPNQPYDLLFLAMNHAQLGDLEKAREYQNLAAKLMAKHSGGQSKLWHDELFEFNQEALAALSECESRASSKPPTIH